MVALAITHTHAGGTQLTGSRKGDDVYDIAERHGFTWRRHAGIHIPNSRDKDAQTHKIDAAVQALRAAGHDVEIRVDNQWRPTAVREAERSGRAERRTDRLDERAALAAGRSAAAHEAAQAIADRRPFGQPVLIGHHSEAKARRDQQRIDDHTDRAVKEGDYADHLAHRADGVAANHAHRHNPRTTMRRIDELEAQLRQAQRSRSGQDAARRLNNHPDATAPHDEHDTAPQRIARLTEEIAHWRGVLAELAASGQFIAWGPEHFAKDDRIRLSGHWYQVTRVNKKSVSVAGDGWPRTADYSKITGRRRDGAQLDTPHGQPWPVDLAIKVDRWEHLRRSTTAHPHDDASRRRHADIRLAQRLVHGLDPAAADAEVAAFAPADDDTTARRELAAAYLSVYDRLTAGERVPAVIATLTPQGVPAWRLPKTAPQDRRACPGWPHVQGQEFVAAGDLIAWVWDRSGHDLTPWRGFVGPVADVTPPKDRAERGVWVTITLTDGTTRDFETAQWLAVHPAGTWEHTTEGDA